MSIINKPVIHKPVDLLISFGGKTPLSTPVYKRYPHFKHSLLGLCVFLFTFYTLCVNKCFYCLIFLSIWFTMNIYIFGLHNRCHFLKLLIGVYHERNQTKLG